MVEAQLRAAGAHTLLLTSPDLHQARERVRIAGDPLGHAAFARLAGALLYDEASEGWSYFELLTVLGWLAGAEAGCDWQVLEVGLGGRLDTTNVVDASKEVDGDHPDRPRAHGDPRRHDRADRRREGGDHPRARRGRRRAAARTRARRGARPFFRGGGDAARGRRRVRAAGHLAGSRRAGAGSCARRCAPTGGCNCR